MENTMYDYDLMLDIDELTVAFEHCETIEISLKSTRLRRAALVLEESGLIEPIARGAFTVTYGKRVG